MAFQINDNGTWKTPTKFHVNDNGTWKEVQTGYVNDLGVWREFYSSGPTVANWKFGYYEAYLKSCTGRQYQDFSYDSADNTELTCNRTSSSTCEKIDANADPVIGIDYGNEYKFYALHYDEYIVDNYTLTIILANFNDSVPSESSLRDKKIILDGKTYLTNSATYSVSNGTTPAVVLYWDSIAKPNYYTGGKTLEFIFQDV